MVIDRSRPADPDTASGRVPDMLSVAGACVLLAGASLANVVFGAASVVAAPMSDELDANAGVTSLFVALFSAGFAAVLVLSGRLGDRYGRRRLLRLGLLVLVATSAAVALAPNAPSLLIARTLQGIGAGIMMPQVLTTFQATTTGRRRDGLTSAYAAVLGAGTVVGQLAGGALATMSVIAWRGVFALVAVLALAALMASAAVPETRGPRGGRHDPTGSVLLAVAVVALVVPLGIGRALGWPLWSWLLLAAAVAAALALFLWEHRLPHHAALIPVGVLRERPLAIGLVMVALFFSSYGAFVYLFATAFEAGLGLSPLDVGLRLFPFAATFILGTLCSPRIARHVPPVRVMALAALAQALCLLAIAAVLLYVPSPGWSLQPLLLVLGLAQALMYTPLIGTVMNALPPEAAGLASGLLSTVQQLFLAIGVAAYALVFSALPLPPLTAFACCLALSAVLAVLFAVSATRLRERPASR